MRSNDSVRSMGVLAFALAATASAVGCSSAPDEGARSSASSMRTCPMPTLAATDSDPGDGTCACTSVDVPGPSDPNAFQRCYAKTTLDFVFAGQHFGPADALSLVMAQALPADARVDGDDASACPDNHLRPYDLDAPLVYPTDGATHTRPDTVPSNWPNVLTHYYEGLDAGGRALTRSQAHTGALLWIEETRKRPGWELVASFFRTLAAHGGFAVEIPQSSADVVTEIVRLASLAGCDVPPADTTLGRGYAIAVANGSPSPSDAHALFDAFGPGHDPVNFFPGRDGVRATDGTTNRTAIVAVGPFDPGSPCGATCLLE